ncbi:PREDICTED: uncharacterized protein LOC109217365 [Nicotiana attenuata]|uniref:uncharacterized protein LOC109217365 n=1 Tax=Nicotiana attenuata TaxID=49451 RepID=UPI00090505A0|nr:PREDICTED: uncharacterized protein LOC109217365 [Nicotiana attenuata]
MYESEDLEMEEKLKLLNKPAVKTIKTIYGDTYDCVDFYKQPAFDHPLLKNHNFHPQMKPTLSRTKQNFSTSSTSQSLRIWLNGKGCPSGTVPIKRITKDDLIRQRHMPPPEDVAFDAQLVGVAIVRIEDSPNNKFAGAQMAASIWNPYVKGQQHSACRLKIKKNSDIIQVGWRAGNTHCFNTLCPGFVLVNTEVPVDKTFKRVSHRGDKISWEDTFSIGRDLVNGNWWLFLEENHIQIGFWPQRIFTDLASFATNVEWGGVVYSPPGEPEPPMGSSFFPVRDTSHDAYCRGITILDDKGETWDIETTVHVDNPNLYRVVDLPHAIPGKFKHFVLYGGPGENA